MLDYFTFALTSRGRWYHPPHPHCRSSGSLTSFYKWTAASGCCCHGTVALKTQICAPQQLGQRDSCLLPLCSVVLATFGHCSVGRVGRPLTGGPRFQNVKVSLGGWLGRLWLLGPDIETAMLRHFRPWIHEWDWVINVYLNALRSQTDTKGPTSQLTIFRTLPTSEIKGNYLAWWRWAIFQICLNGYKRKLLSVIIGSFPLKNITNWVERIVTSLIRSNKFKGLSPTSAGFKLKHNLKAVENISSTFFMFRLEPMSCYHGDEFPWAFQLVVLVLRITMWRPKQV